MHKGITRGQYWLLQQMADRGAITGQLSTFMSPEPVGMSAMRGLIKRGFAVEGREHFFSITDAGRRELLKPEPLNAAEHRLKRFEAKVHKRLDEIAKEIEGNGPFVELSAERLALEWVLEEL